MKYNLSDLKEIFAVSINTDDQSILNYALVDILKIIEHPIYCNEVLVDNTDTKFSIDNFPAYITRKQIEPQIQLLYPYIKDTYFKILEPKSSKISRKNVIKLQDAIDYIELHKKSIFKIIPIEDKIYNGPVIFDDDHVFYDLRINSDLSYNLSLLNIKSKYFTVQSKDLNKFKYASGNGDFDITYVLESEDKQTIEWFSDSLNFDYSSLSQPVNHKIFVSKADLETFIFQVEKNIDKLKWSLNAS